MERHFLERTPTDQGSERPAPTATDPDPDGDERRSALRKSLDQVPWITGVRISPGDPTQLINILARRSAVRLAPGSLKALMVFSTDKPVRASGRVVRCQVNSIARDGSVRYRTAICFDRELELDLNGENLDSDGAVARPEDPPAIANEGRAHAGVKGSFEATWNTPSGEQVVRVSHLSEDGCFIETPISVPLADWVSSHRATAGWRSVLSGWPGRQG